MLKTIRTARLLALLPVLCTAIAGAAEATTEAAGGSAPVDAAALRVMTFNIRYDNPRDGDNIWPNRRKMVASMIRLHRADIAGLQEVQPGQLRELQVLLPEWKWLGLKTTGLEEDSERVPMIYRPDRLELLEDGEFWLSETPEVAGSKGWDTALPRMVVWGKFRDRRTEKEFFVFNTHFDHIGKQARLESAKLLTSKAAEMAGSAPVVIMGDMNCLDTDPPYAAFLGKAEDAGADKPAERRRWLLHDAKDVSLHPHHGPTSTFQGFGRLPPDRRIDYIFVTPKVKVLQHATLADRWDGARWPSDHLPVLAEVCIVK